MPRPKKGEPSRHTDSNKFLFKPSDLNGALPKSAQVYDLVRTAIIQLAMTPGAPVDEKEICEQLGISRTPLREAILQLSNEGLVEVRPNSGTFVSSIDLQHVFDGQLVRASLELRAVRLAARRTTKLFIQQLDFNMHQQRVLAEDNNYGQFYELDEAMHQLICEFGTSNRIWRIVTSAKAHLDRIRRLQIPEGNHLDIILTEHTAIVEGLRQGDEEAAAGAMDVHINRVFQTVRHLLDEREEFFAENSRQQLARFDELAR